MGKATGALSSRFNSQHPESDSTQLPVSSVPGDPILSSVLNELLYTCGIDLRHALTQTQTCTHK